MLESILEADLQQAAIVATFVYQHGHARREVSAHGASEAAAILEARASFKRTLRVTHGVEVPIL